MDRINIYSTDGDRVGHFYPDKAEKFASGYRWDGSNTICITTGSQWDDETLYRTAGGKWVLNRDSHRHCGGPDTYEYLTDEQAREWLLRSEANDDTVKKYFGAIPEEEDRRAPGRPEIGGAVHVRLGDLLPLLDKHAEEEGTTRVALIRRYVAEGLANDGVMVPLDAVVPASSGS